MATTWLGDVTLMENGWGYSYFKGNFGIDTITRSGNTVTVTGKFGVHNDGGPTSHYVYPINAQVRDILGWQQVVGGGVNIANGSWVTVNVSFSFTVSTTATSKQITVDWLYNNGYYGNTIYYTLTFPSGVPTPDLTGIGVTPTTATVGWFVDDGEGSLNGTGYIYGGTTASPTTQLFTTTLKNDVFVDTGLSPNTMYYYRGRIKDSNNNWGPYTPDLRLTTLAEPGKLYGSVNGQSKKIQKLYGSVGGQTKEIVKLYGSVNGQTKLIYSK